MRFSLTPILLTLILLVAPLPASAGKGTFGLSFDDREAAIDSSGGRAAWLSRVAAARARYEAFVARASLRLNHRFHGVEERVGPGASHAAANHTDFDSAVATDILGDPTLRRNDLFVSVDAVFVFQGLIAARHRPEEFARLPTLKIETLGLRLAGAR